MKAGLPVLKLQPEQTDNNLQSLGRIPSETSVVLISLLIKGT